MTRRTNAWPSIGSSVRYEMHHLRDSRGGNRGWAETISTPALPRRPAPPRRAFSSVVHVGMICLRPLSVVGYRLSVIGCQLSGVDRRPRIILTTDNRQLAQDHLFPYTAL